MMLSVTRLLYLFLLLSSIQLLTAKSLNLPQARAITEDSANSDLIVCKNGGQYNDDDEKCDCKSGYIGTVCENVESRRCEVRSSKANAHQHPTGCPSGMWCVADNINCFFYVCPKTLGWCVPYAANLGRHAMTTEEPIGTDLMKRFKGDDV